MALFRSQTRRHMIKESNAVSFIHVLNCYSFSSITFLYGNEPSHLYAKQMCNLVKQLFLKTKCINLNINKLRGEKLPFTYFILFTTRLHFKASICINVYSKYVCIIYRIKREKNTCKVIHILSSIPLCPGCM